MEPKKIDEMTEKELLQTIARSNIQTRDKVNTIREIAIFYLVISIISFMIYVAWNVSHH